MTLVLTEVSSVGVAMAADSAITKIRAGKIFEIDQQGWHKILKVPKIRAGISYWGMIGAVTNQQFDTWLRNLIDTNNYHDLDTFADFLVSELNNACKNRPLKNGYDVGIHLAGYHKWSDGVRRPVFYHIHNGHGRITLNEQKDTHGKIISINPTWYSDPRKLFEKHPDFPNPQRSLNYNLNILNHSGLITRNGDFFLYAVFQNYINEAIKFIRLSPNIRIPSNPSNIASRKGFLHIILESTIRLYRCSNLSKMVGGKVSSLAIAPNRYVN